MIHTLKSIPLPLLIIAIVLVVIAVVALVNIYLTPFEEQAGVGKIERMER